MLALTLLALTLLALPLLTLTLLPLPLLPLALLTLALLTLPLLTLALLTLALLAFAVLLTASLLARLPLLPAARLEHLAEVLQTRKPLLDRLIVAVARAALAGSSERLLHFLQLVANLIETLREIGLRHHHILAQAAADVVGVALHGALHIHLLDFARRLAHFRTMPCALGCLQVMRAAACHALLSSFFRSAISLSF